MGRDELHCLQCSNWHGTGHVFGVIRSRECNRRVDYDGHDQTKNSQSGISANRHCWHHLPGNSLNHIFFSSLANVMAFNITSHLFSFFCFFFGSVFSKGDQDWSCLLLSLRGHDKATPLFCVLHLCEVEEEGDGRWGGSRNRQPPTRSNRCVFFSALSRLCAEITNTGERIVKKKKLRTTP